MLSLKLRKGCRPGQELKTHVRARMFSTNWRASKIERLVPNGHKDSSSLSLESDHGLVEHRKLLLLIFTHEIEVVEESLLRGGGFRVAL